MTVGILGAGAFGTALACALATNGKVLLWSRNHGHAAEMQRVRQNQRHLPDIVLPDAAEVVSSMAAMKSVAAILLAVPAQQTFDLVTRYGLKLPKVPLVICAKGIEKGTERLQSEVIAQVLPSYQMAVLTGPGFANEIAAGLPTALTLACEDLSLGQRLQSQLSTPRLRLYLTDDLRGVQLGGALKNVVALACGMVAGAGLGESARAALMTRGFTEMSRLAMAMGAKAETLTGLSGLGDLALTCNSSQSRNFANGFALGAGQATTQGTTVEGIATAFAACELAQKYAVEMPIAVAVAAVLDGKLSIGTAMDMLLTRPLKAENTGGEGE